MTIHFPVLEFHQKHSTGFFANCSVGIIQVVRRGRFSTCQILAGVSNDKSLVDSYIPVDENKIVTIPTNNKRDCDNSNL